MSNDLGHERIIVRRDARARSDVRVHAYALLGGPGDGDDLPGAGTKIVVGVLGIDPAFDGAAGAAQVTL